MRKPIIPQRIENDYSRKLRKVAHIVGTIIQHHTIIEKDNEGQIVRVALAVGLNEILRSYAGSITPWANTIASIMLKDVDKANANFFLSVASQMAQKLKEERAHSAIGLVAEKLQNDQVTLIKSIPLEAAERAQNLAREAASGGRRMDEVAEMIMASGDVAKSRANTIARTEISKAHSSFTQARATYIGSQSYQWASVGDEIVRESHAEMDGNIINWNEEPTLSDGMTGHAGNFPNCRCFSIPLFNET